VKGKKKAASTHKSLHFHAVLSSFRLVLTGMSFREVACVSRRLGAIPLAALLFVTSSFSLPVNAAEEKPAADKAKETEKIYEIGGDVQSPKLIHVVEPAFDPNSEDAFTTGIVKLQIIITAQGSVRDPKVLSGHSDQQNKKATDAVLQWRFQPALLKGKPVSVRATVEVNFHLL
jgi:TonB family protein